MEKNEKKIAVVAFGGNALRTDGTTEEKVEHMRRFLVPVIVLLKNGYHVLITHGNGPQVGRLMTLNPEIPLWRHVITTQNEIGEIIIKALELEMKVNTDLFGGIALDKTEVVVNFKDPAFDNPTKPVGASFKEIPQKVEGVEYSYKKNIKGLYRVVVPSPNPIKILLDEDKVRDWIKYNIVPVLCGGGGAGVTIDDEYIHENIVIDKDLTAAALATQINADLLLIIQEAPCVFNMQGKADDSIKYVLNMHPDTFLEYYEEWWNNNLDELVPTPVASIKIKEAKKILEYLEDGSVKPKLQAAINFVSTGKGKTAIITNLHNFKTRFDHNFESAMDYGTILKS